MKKLLIASRMLLGIGLIAFMLTSCKSETKTEDTKEAAEDQNEAQLDKVPSEKDEADFFVDVAEIDLAEIELGNLAQQKSMNSDVKKYGEMLVSDHTKSSTELKELANSRQLTLPSSVTDEGKDQYNKLNAESGLDFDKKFIDMAIDAHEKAIKIMEQASTNDDNDEAVKKWASDKVPALTKHLQQAKMIKEKLNKK